jgi:hypothetical protein
MMSDLVTVFESGNAAILAVAKVTLESAGIRYVTQGEGVQDLFGWGRLFSGYNMITGPVRICVTPENAELAREALATLRE